MKECSKQQHSMAVTKTWSEKRHLHIVPASVTCGYVCIRGFSGLASPDGFSQASWSSMSGTITTEPPAPSLLHPPPTFPLYFFLASSVKQDIIVRDATATPSPSQTSSHWWDPTGTRVPNFRHIQHPYLCFPPNESWLTCYLKVHLNTWLHPWKQVLVFSSITPVKESRLLVNRYAPLKGQVNQTPRNTHDWEDYLIWPK